MKPNTSKEAQKTPKGKSKSSTSKKVGIFQKVKQLLTFNNPSSKRQKIDPANPAFRSGDKNDNEPIWVQQTNAFLNLVRQDDDDDEVFY
jgi:hypothetical protein